MLSGQSEFPIDIGVIDHRRFTVKWKSGLCRFMSDSVECPHKIKMPGCPSEFPIRKNRVAKLLQLPDQLRDGLILNLLQVVVADPPCVKCPSGFLELLWSEKASYIIISKWCLKCLHLSRSSCRFPDDPLSVPFRFLPVSNEKEHLACTRLYSRCLDPVPDYMEDIFSGKIPVSFEIP